jgi:hypothetical protein
MIDDSAAAPMGLWLNLPGNVRRGFLRLYLVVSAPWVGWFGYQMLAAIPDWRSVSAAFWSLLIVPVGGPILFLVILWVVAGFREAGASTGEARREMRRSPIHEQEPRQASIHDKIHDKQASSGKAQLSSEAEAVTKKLEHLMADEKAQNDRLPQAIRSQVLGGDSCDAIAGGAGEFGRDPRSPIPVNGPLGEVIYLSNLNTSTAKQIMFHRLGSIKHVDAYETVSFDGAVWDILFFDPYHPRKSRYAPIGYRVAADTEREKFLLGANRYVASFPDQVLDAIALTYGELLGGRVRPPKVGEAIGRMNFKRPNEHVGRLNLYMALLTHKAPA